jgi:hypothetical protein
VDPAWEEVVEASFRPRRRELALTSFEDAFDVRLPAKTKRVAEVEQPR